jgi:hypothetical protein
VSFPPQAFTRSCSLSSIIDLITTGRRVGMVPEDRVGLAQLIRFLVVKFIHPGSNLKFDMCVVFTANYSFSERRRPCR